MATGTQANLLDNPHNNDPPVEIDFSKGVCGKFFKPGAPLNLPVHLEAEAQTHLPTRPQACGIDFGQLVNELFKKDIELIETVRQRLLPDSAAARHCNSTCRRIILKSQQKLVL